VVQCVLYERAIAFGMSKLKHSRIFLISSEPYSNRVFSWFTEEATKARSWLRNVLQFFFLNISSLRLASEVKFAADSMTEHGIRLEKLK